MERTPQSHRCISGTRSTQGAGRSDPLSGGLWLTTVPACSKGSDVVKIPQRRGCENANGLGKVIALSQCVDLLLGATKQFCNLCSSTYVIDVHFGSLCCTPWWCRIDDTRVLNFVQLSRRLIRISFCRTLPMASNHSRCAPGCTATWPTPIRGSHLDCKGHHRWLGGCAPAASRFWNGSMDDTRNH